MIKHVKVNTLIILCVLIFPLLPFVSVLLFTITIAGLPRISKFTFYSLFIFLSIYLGLINVTKVPESDLINYYEYFFLAEDFPFLTYILLVGKEPVFFIYNYVIFYLTNGSIHFYILISTIIAYTFFFSAILNFFQAIKASQKVVLSAVIFAAFFPQLFSLSAHLIRQFMAASILLYALVQKIFYQKTVWPYILLTTLIHSTSLLFVPLLYLNALRKKLNFKMVFMLMALLYIIPVTIGFVTEQLIKIIGHNFLTYAISRANNENLFGFQPIDPLQLILMAIMLFILFIRQYGTSKFSNNNSTIGFFHFTNIFFIFCIFILVNLSRNDLAQRFSFYSYFFLPLILPLAFNLKNKNSRYIRIVISVFMLVLFIYRLPYGSWEYGSITQLLFGNVFNFF
jgi:hypothetical protein